MDRIELTHMTSLRRSTTGVVCIVRKWYLVLAFFNHMLGWIECKTNIHAMADIADMTDMHL